MASVTFPPALGGDGSTVTDDANPSTGLANGGHRTRFVPSLGQAVAVMAGAVSQAAASASTASTQAGLATTNGAAQVALATAQAVIAADEAADALSSAAAAAASESDAEAAALAAAISAGSVASYPPQAGEAGKFLQTNGISASWAFAPIAGGGSSTSSAVDITLTAASGRVQNVTMTAADKSVTLPDATTLTTGGALFVVKNAGTIAFAVRDTSGLVIAGVEPGQVAVLYLTNNSTSAGTWALGDASVAAPMSGLYPDAALVVNAVASSVPSVTPLSAATALLVYSNGSTTVEARVLTWTAGVLSAGAALTVATNNSTVLRAVALSSTQGVVIFDNSASPNVQACTLNVSGTTVTAGAVLNVQAGTTTTDVAIEKASATQAICVFRNASGFLATSTLDVSGTTLTKGTTLVVNALSSDRMYLNQISATTFLATFNDGSNTRTANYVLTVSGTTMTAGAVLNHPTGEYAPLSACVLSSTAAVLLVKLNTGPGNLSIVTLTISGTTVARGQAVATDRIVQTAVVSKINSNTALVVFTSNAAGRWMYTLKLASNIVSFGSITGLLSYSSGSPSLAVATNSKLALFAYNGTSNFMTVDPINIAI